MRRLLPVIAALALLGCGKKAAPAAVTDGGSDGGPTDAIGDARTDALKPVACNGRCAGVCRGVCTGICLQRADDDTCASYCEEICVGTCEGTCTKVSRGGDGGTSTVRDAAGDRRDGPTPDAPVVAPDPTVGNWVNRANTTTLSWPPIGHAGAMAYDSVRQRVVMFGGATTPGNATWEWDGVAGAWELRQQMNGVRPTPRYGHAMAFDEGRGVVVMYGGIDASGGSNSDVWEWDGTAQTWTKRGPGPSPSRWGHAMVYQAVTNTLVMFGGSYRHPTLGDGNLYDIWEYDGGADSWVNKTYPIPPSWPRARRGHALVYDSARSVTVMYGGEVLAVGGATSDVWEWDGAANVFTDRTPGSLPPDWPGPRAWHGMIFDGTNVILFGGAYPNLWEWNGDFGSWRALQPVAGAPWPPTRTRFPMAFDSIRRTLVLTGAPWTVGANSLADLWEWSRD